MIIQQQLNYKIRQNQNIKEEANESITLKINENSNSSMYNIHKAVIKQLTNKRHGNTSTKTRSEVRGGGKKPWKQKGTGRARAGSIRSPLKKGGGVIFGPKPKKYMQKINKKENRLAIRNIIANKFKVTTAVDNFLKNLVHPSTKTAKENIHNLGIIRQKNKKILIIVEKKEKNTYLSLRNLKYTSLINVKHLNTLELLNADQIIITKQSLNLIEQIYK
uniref:Large ribosomal subunit protein uL4c n=1 Tax=Gastroclonium compressum TaxID=1852973 RepID=A0A173G049_GASCM|nr:50S ribosomal protein L4 [Coeloseira compressa]ANH09656.1 50S ribosomal protein L4 [Coeloseira compressa]